MPLSFRSGSPPDRVESYTRWTLYGSLFPFPLLALAVVAAAHDGPGTIWTAPTVVYLVAVSAATALGTLVLRRILAAGLSSHSVRGGLRGYGVPGWMLAGFAALVAVTALTALWLPVGDLLAGRVGGVGVALAIGVLPLAPLMATTTVIGVVSVAAGALTAVVAMLSGTGGGSVGGGSISVALRVLIAVTFAIGAVAASVRISVWILQVVRELELSRAAHAQLAVAEERLRFSRDLHDVIGRALTAIAVKSEFAAELARRGHDSAAEEMSQVRDLAHDTMREVREVVAGYRTADLTAELDGARSVLTSSGARTTVTGADMGAQLPAEAQQAFGWVIREAVTNVVRHASASECTIALTEHGSHVQLTVTNDGARPGRPGGTGLIGLAERLTSVDGTLQTALRGDTFTLTARIPRHPTRPDDQQEDQ